MTGVFPWPLRRLAPALLATLVLADENNRTPPTPQAALLQSMQEYRVTAGGTTHELPLPFLVFATLFSYFALARRKWQQGESND